MSSNFTWRFSDSFRLHPKQKEVLNYVGDKRYIYFGGARGGGKTLCAVAVATYVALKYPGIKIAFVRKTLRELEQDIILRFLNALPPELIEYKPSRHLLLFKTDDNDAKCSRINFISIENVDDVQKEQGIERHMYIIDEANQFHEDVLRRMRGSLRNTVIPNWVPCMFMTGNPGGMSDPYFKKYFVLQNYQDWTEKEREAKDQYQFIQSLVYDNPTVVEMNPEYLEMLDTLPKHLRAAWLEGRWDVFSGQFFEEWSEEIHIVKEPFDIPLDWVRWRGIDLGQGTHPSVCLSLAQSPDDGTIYCYNEWACTSTVGEFVEGIKRTSDPRETFVQNFADPNIFAKDNVTYDNSQYFYPDIPLEKANNQRMLGWRNLKQWLHWTPGDSENPGMSPHLKIFPNCTGLIKTLPTLQYAKNGIEDLNTRQLDDYSDALRYAVAHIQYGYLYNQAGQLVKINYHKDQVDIDAFPEVDERDAMAYESSASGYGFGLSDDYYVRNDRGEYSSIYTNF